MILVLAPVSSLTADSLCLATRLVQLQLRLQVSSLWFLEPLLDLQCCLSICCCHTSSVLQPNITRVWSRHHHFLPVLLTWALFYCLDCLHASPSCLYLVYCCQKYHPLAHSVSGSPLVDNWGVRNEEHKLLTGKKGVLFEPKLRITYKLTPKTK